MAGGNRVMRAKMKAASGRPHFSSSQPILFESMVEPPTYSPPDPNKPRGPRKRWGTKCPECSLVRSRNGACGCP